MNRKKISVTIECLVVGQLATNCYVVFDDNLKQAVIIDPGDDAQYIIDKLTYWHLTPVALFATHGHFDHIMACYELQHTYTIPLYMHKDDIFLVNRMEQSVKHFLGIQSDPKPTVSRTYKDSEVVTFGSLSFTVIHTPGHTPGSVSLHFLQANALFVGDTIFAQGAVGRTDFAYSSSDDLMRSIQTILSLHDSTVLYSGHGEKTTVGQEKTYHDGTIHV